jgi:hypothetical protein
MVFRTKYAAAVDSSQAWLETYKTFRLSAMPCMVVRIGMVRIKREWISRYCLRSLCECSGSVGKQKDYGVIG